MNEDDVAKQVAEICDRNKEGLLAIVGLLIAREPARPEVPDVQAQETRRLIERIKAKDFSSTNEAALLLGCSPQHLRNLVQRAIDQTTEYPIPFRDLDGVVVFPIHE